MGALDDKPCNATTCSGLVIVEGIARDPCTRTSCDYSRDFRPGKNWKCHYQKYKIEQGERLANQQQAALQRQLGQRHALLTERHSLSLKQNVLDQFGNASNCPFNPVKDAACQGLGQGQSSCYNKGSDPNFSNFALLPEQQEDIAQRLSCAEQFYEYSEHEKQRKKEHAQQMIRDKGTHILQDTKNIHWAQQHQREQEDKYQCYQREYRTRFPHRSGAGNGGLQCESQGPGPARGNCEPLEVVEVKVPPRDIMQPIPFMIKSQNYRGGPIPTGRSQGEPLCGLNVELNMHREPRPFYRNYPEVPYGYYDLHPKQLGTFGSAVVNTRSTDYRIHQRRQFPEQTFSSFIAFGHAF